MGARNKILVTDLSLHLNKEWEWEMTMSDGKVFQMGPTLGKQEPKWA